MAGVVHHHGHHVGDGHGAARVVAGPAAGDHDLDVVQFLVKANEELTYLALHDNLTKLANRLLLDDRLKQALRTARRDKDLTFALMFLDLDGFKAINDVYGHHVGDLLLIEVAQRIRGALREEDTVARMGGDEFVILALNMDPASAGRLAEDLIEAIREPFRIDIHQLAISLSIGIAIYPNDGIDQDDLLTNADAAMYHAKGMGRDTYCFFQSSMNANVHRQLQLVQDMRRALENSELRLHYQPSSWRPMVPSSASRRWCAGSIPRWAC